MIQALLLVLALHAPPQRAAQSDSALDAQTRTIAMQLRCPVCRGESIQESPAELAKQMRDLVRDQLSKGKSPDEVKAYFVSKYGEWILLQPEIHGFNVVVYALPVLVVLGGLGVIVVAVKRWTAALDTTTTTTTTTTTDHGPRG